MGKWNRSSLHEETRSKIGQVITAVSAFYSGGLGFSQQGERHFLWVLPSLLCQVAHKTGTNEIATRTRRE